MDPLCRPLLSLVQAQLLLPAGEGLVQLEAQLHHDSIQLHSYALAPPEERLAAVLQQHLLGVSASSQACACLVEFFCRGQLRDHQNCRIGAGYIACGCLYV